MFYQANLKKTLQLKINFLSDETEGLKATQDNPNRTPKF